MTDCKEEFEAKCARLDRENIPYLAYWHWDRDTGAQGYCIARALPEMERWYAAIRRLRDAGAYVEEVRRI